MHFFTADRGICQIKIAEYFSIGCLTEATNYMTDAPLPIKNVCSAILDFL